MRDYAPDKWVVIEISSAEEKVQKVLASWYGGYAGSDSWKLSSGILTTVDRDDHFEFHNSSGSIYRCYKGAEGMSGYTSMIYSDLESKQTDDIKIRIVEEACQYANVK